MTGSLYLDPPARCVRLTDLAAREGGAAVPRAGEAAVTYALPANATDEVREYLRAGAVAEFEPEWTARLPGGRVYGAGAVLSADGTCLARDVAVDFGKRFEEHWLLAYRKIRTPEILSGTTAVIATTLGRGYAHWLLEEWPRLLSLSLGGCDAVIAHAAGGLGSAALARAGFAGRVIEPRRHAHFACEQLVVPSLVGRAGWPTPTRVRMLREQVPEIAATASPWGERIYVSRERARRRRVTNEGELWPRLEAAGFSRVFAEEWPWAEQIAGFRAAKVIVAPHGAGLANLVFCTAGTRVVECFGRNYVNPCFWRLAAVAGLDYRALVAAGEGPLAHALAANKEDMAVDVDAVVRAVG